MGKVDVISAVFESFGLIRAHYKEVTLPLIVFILISGAAQFGGSSFSGKSSSGAGLANLMTGLDGSMLALGGLLIAIIAVAVVVILVLSVVSEATRLYICEHFYAILNRKKIKGKWTGRFGRLAVKSLAMSVFYMAIFAAVFILPLLQIWNAISALQAASAAGIIGALLSVAVAFLVACAIMLAISFVLAPLWVYYAMDGLGFFDSVGKSVKLVTGNLSAFAMLWLVFLLLGIGTAAVAFLSALCCLSWLVVPVLGAGVSLLHGVTLMKIKLAFEKK